MVWRRGVGPVVITAVLANPPSDGPSLSAAPGNAPVDASLAASATSATSAAGESTGERKLTFQEVMDLVMKGEPVPGVRKIPDQVHEGPASTPTLQPRRKPWEQAAAAVSQ